MGNGLTALFFGIGFATWVFAYMMKQTGGNMRSSVMVAAGAGLVGFFVIFTILTTIFA